MDSNLLEQSGTEQQSRQFFKSSADSLDGKLFVLIWKQSRANSLDGNFLFFFNRKKSRVESLDSDLLGQSGTFFLNLRLGNHFTRILLCNLFSLFDYKIKYLT